MRTLRLAIAFALCAAVAPVSAQAISKNYELNIPRQPLETALKEFAQQTGLQVARFADTVDGSAVVGPVNGKYSADEALKSLLGSSGLTYKVVNERTIAVTKPSDVPRETKREPDKTTMVVGAEANGYTRLAQAEAESNSADPGSAGLPLREAEVVELEEILVTGSRLPSTIVESPQPVNVYTREDIDRSGQTTISEFLNTLPAVSTSRVEGQGGSAGTTTVSLRGLKTGSTLVLLNGRRIESAGVTATYFDLNLIPLSAVERIDVLPSGSSAVYGGDALAGIVNVVLRSEYEGTEIDATYGAASDIDEVSFSAAQGWNWSRGSLSILGTYFDRGTLLGTDREITASDDYRRFGGQDLRSRNSNPATISSITSGNLPGLTCSVAGVPLGSSGVGLTPADFQPTCGVPNFTSVNSLFSTISESTRAGGLLNGTYLVSEDTELFSELLYSEVEQTLHRAPLTFSGVVPAANPFNPFDQDVRVTYAFPDVPNTSVTETEYARGLVGSRGKWGGDWSWEVAGWVTEMKADTTSLAVDAAAVRTSLNSANPATSLNVFQDGPGASENLLRSFFSDDTSRFESALLAANAFARGTLLEWKPGAIKIVAGTEYSDERLLRATGTTLDADRTFHAFFTELRAPLLGTAGDPNSRLTASLAARYDHYSDFGSEISPQFGLTWNFNERWMLRASHGDAFKPPSLANLYTSNTVSTVTVTDPRRGGQPATVENFSGGNPLLDPETAESTTFGIVYSNVRGNGLQFALTHWDNELAALIVTPVPSLLMANEATFSDRVIRGAPSAQDIAAGWPGPVIRLNSTLENFGVFHLTGIDAETSWMKDTRIGRFQPRLAASYTYRYDGSLSFAAPVTDRVSRLDGSGYSPRWKGALGASWEWRGWNVSVAGRYVGPYLASDRVRELGDIWFVDASVRLDVGRITDSAGSFWNGFNLDLGAVNLLDADIDFTGVSSDPYDRSQYDIRGRFVYARLGYRW